MGTNTGYRGSHTVPANFYPTEFNGGYRAETARRSAGVVRQRIGVAVYRKLPTTRREPIAVTTRAVTPTTTRLRKFDTFDIGFCVLTALCMTTLLIPLLVFGWPMLKRVCEHLWNCGF